MDTINVPVVGLIFQALFLVGAVIASLWQFSNMINRRFEHAKKNSDQALLTFTQAFEEEMKRSYDRMDERKAEADRTFVRIDTHNLTIQFQNDKVEERFRTVIEKFDLKLGSLEKVVTSALNLLHKQ